MTNNCCFCHYCLTRLNIQSKDIIESANETTSQVLTFVDNSLGDIDNEGYNQSIIASSGSTMNTSLTDFLSRPTKIDSRIWTTSTLTGQLGAKIEPWWLFLNNTVIKNKLQNYAFLRAKLCMKIIINATPFHYGLARVAYEPSVNASNTGYRTSKIRTNVTTSAPLIIPYSQLPGVWVHPADNSGGEIHVPFFSHADWMPLDSAERVKALGTLTYFVGYPLYIASTSGSDTVTIDTYAWLEDVELNGSTSVLTLQAKDEYDGPISKPASAIAAVSRSLTNVPVIGKFARATEIGASAIAGIASIFGFTNTPIIDGVHAMLPVTAPHLASSEISTPVQKLTLDPKQELSVDPTIHGLPSIDEMAITNLVRKKSALTIFDWSTTDVVDTVKFSSAVNPCFHQTISVLDSGSNLIGTRIYHTPLSYLGFAFSHWRGDILLELEVICTKFHKGRLKVSWDPLIGVGSSPIDENKAYTTILDIGETNKAVLRIPYHQALSFLETRRNLSDIWDNGGTAVSSTRFDNGIIIISVLTPLMSPVSPQTVGVKVTVSAADNFEYANPSQCLGGAATLPPPSFFAVQAKDEIDTESTVISFGDNGTSHPQRYKKNMGESVQSLRTLLHRYSLYDTSLPGGRTATNCSVFCKSFTRFPPMFGFDPDGQTTVTRLASTGGTAPFNMTPTHPITYFGMMYAGFTGGVNYITNVSNDLYPYVGDVRVERYNLTTMAQYRRGSELVAAPNTNTVNQQHRFYNMEVALSAHTGGAAFTNTLTNGSLSWYQPMELPTNLCYPDATYSINGNVNDRTTNECSVLKVCIKQQTANTSTIGMTFVNYAGTGPDFNLIWFLCCPTLDYYEAVPFAA